VSTCVEKLPCKDCGSSDSIQTYLNVDDALGMEWYTSFCHGECWEQKGDPYTSAPAPKVHVKSAQEIKEELDDIVSCKLFDKKFRMIPGKYYEKFRCRLLLSEFDGKTPYAIGFPMTYKDNLIGWKCRPLKKKEFYGIGKTSGADPFGFHRAMKIGGKSLWITEGEFDAIALEYCLCVAGGGSDYPVVSLTHGGGSIAKNLNGIKDRIAEFDNIVFVLDDDIVGRQAEEVAKELLGNRAYFIRKPDGCKDANDAVKFDEVLMMGRLALGMIK